jgi:ketosteroid isomerase-like protein
MSDDPSALEDRRSIEQLIYRYSDAVTRADYEQMATVFAADAIWESPLLGMHFESARAFIDFQIDGSTALGMLIQTAMGPVIDLRGPDDAIATTNIREIIRGTTTNDGPYGPTGTEINVDQYGIYFDEISKIDNAWKFTRRVFAPILIAAGGVSGDVVTTRPISRPQ